jgi:hypothetical protein
MRLQAHESNSMRSVRSVLIWFLKAVYSGLITVSSRPCEESSKSKDVIVT